ncbi:TPA: hypothetical protein DF272_02480 [Candidatus Falkowbacteria bacterium]|nr:hypothetical protein [Candidatus Falkowbacteria bacterium]
MTASLMVLRFDWLILDDYIAHVKVPVDFLSRISYNVTYTKQGVPPPAAVCMQKPKRHRHRIFIH